MDILSKDKLNMSNIKGFSFKDEERELEEILNYKTEANFAVELPPQLLINLTFLSLSTAFIKYPIGIMTINDLTLLNL